MGDPPVVEVVGQAASVDACSTERRTCAYPDRIATSVRPAGLT
jgi:hypothetical protein